MRKNNRFPYFLSTILLLLQASGANANDMAEGERLYTAGRIPQAKAYFARAVETNTSSAAAHYFLGHCLVAEKDYNGAIAEYRRAMEFTDDKKMEDYCRSALQRLAPLAEARTSTPLPAGKIEDSAVASGTDAKVERVKAIMAKAAAEAKVVVDRGEERCKPIMDDEKAALAVMNIRLHGRLGSLETTSSDDREDTKKDYERRIEAIRHDAKSQAKMIMDQGRRDATSVGQGLPNIDELTQDSK